MPHFAGHRKCNKYLIGTKRRLHCFYLREFITVQGGTTKERLRYNHKSMKSKKTRNEKRKHNRGSKSTRLKFPEDSKKDA